MKVKTKHINKALINRFFIVIHISFVLISCNNTIKSSDKNIFRYNSSSGITSLDPAFARTQENIRAVNQIFNGLVQLDTALQITPSIAKSWDISNDGKMYTFHLRNDVLFHNHPIFKGVKRTVIAQDFVYSFDRIINPKTASDGAWIFNGLIDKNHPFEAIDDTTFRIHLTKPFVPFLGMLSMAYCFVLPHEAITHFGANFGKNPIGTGPFKLANWKEGIRLNLIKNENYFESTQSQIIPKLGAISISFIQNKQTELLEFIQGKLDVFTGLESSYKDEILTANGNLKEKYRIDNQLITTPFLNTEFLAFNVEDKNSIVYNVEVRKAISYAIDRTSMIKYLRNSIGQAANGGFIPIGLPGHKTYTSAAFQPEKARVILRGLKLNLQKPLILSTTKDYLDLCILVQKNLADVGLTIKIDVIPSSLLKQQKSSGDISFFRGSWIADYPDAENYMACFYSKNKAPNGPNYTRLINADFDALYERIITEKQEDKRIKLFSKMEDILEQQSPFIVLFYDESLWLKSKNILNFKVNSLNYLDLRFVQKN